MGRSSWRDEYSFPVYADEVFTVARTTGLYESGKPPIIAGHSFGGVQLRYAGGTRPQDVGGAIIIDSYFRPDNIPPPEHPIPPNVHLIRAYPTLADALARFRLQPVQQCANLFIIDYIARHSLKQVEAKGTSPAGWVWRFDPALRAKMRKTAIAPYLSNLACPLILMSGGRSTLLTPPIVEFMKQTAPKGTPWVTIPDAEHHVMLDQPLALATAIDAAMAVWPRA
jgi:pimeloyl-ACP methyl ester carboxylesterase